MADFFGRSKKVLIFDVRSSVVRELCFRLIDLRSKQLVLVDSNENFLSQLCSAISKISPHFPVKPVICNISLPDTDIQELLIEENPHVVFFDSAKRMFLKFLHEDHAFNVVRDLILTTRKVVKAIDNADVEKFVFLSSCLSERKDNIVSVCLRIAESYVRSFSLRKKKDFVVVRLENVFGENEPLWKLLHDVRERRTDATASIDRKISFTTDKEAAQDILLALARTEPGLICSPCSSSQPVSLSELIDEIRDFADGGEEEKPPEEFSDQVLMHDLVFEDEKESKKPNSTGQLDPILLPFNVLERDIDVIEELVGTGNEEAVRQRVEILRSKL